MNNKLFKKIISAAIPLILLTSILFSQSLALAQSPPPAPSGGGATPKSVVDEIEKRSEANTKDTGCGGFLSFNIICWIRVFIVFLFEIVALLIGAIASLFIQLAALMITFLTSEAGRITANPVVATGFSITLNLANLGFVLVIIIIAFATILRVEKYQLKVTLRNLIIAAVLINFSFAIAGVFLDFSQILGEFFIDKVTGGGTNIAARLNFSEQIATALEVQNLLKTEDDPSFLKKVSERAKTEFNKGIFQIISILMAVFFTILITLVMWGIAGMLLIRYVALIILLVLMPIAWLFWTIPDTVRYWSRWWGEFLKWVFFFPAIAFFLYLPLFSADKIKNQLGLVGKTADAKLGIQSQTFISDAPGLILFQVAMMGLLVGGLIVANKMGVSGAGLALKFAGATKKFALGAAWRGTKATGRYAKRQTLGRLGRKGTEEGAKSVADKFQDFAAKTRIPLVGGALRGIARGVTRISEAGKGKTELEDAAKKAKDMSLQDRIAATRFGSETLKIEVLKAMQKDGQLNKLDMSEFLTDKNKQAFINRGEESAFEKIEKSSMTSVDMRMLLDLSESRPGDEQIVQQLKEATDKHLGKYTDEDKKLPEFGKIFSDRKAFGREGAIKKTWQEALAQGAAKSDPRIISKIPPKLEGRDIEPFEKATRESLNKLPGNETGEEKEPKTAKGRALKALKKSLTYRLGGADFDIDFTTGTTT